MNFWFVAIFVTIFSVTLGWLLAAPFYFIGRFVRQQILNNKNYRRRESQLGLFAWSTPTVLIFALLFGFLAGAWYESVILFSVAWGCTLGYASLESFSDVATWLPEEPVEQM